MAMHVNYGVEPIKSPPGTDRGGSRPKPPKAVAQRASLEAPQSVSDHQKPKRRLTHKTVAFWACCGKALSTRIGLVLSVSNITPVDDCSGERCREQNYSDRVGVCLLDALDAMAQSMAKSEPGQDVAVILVSSHGEMIDGQFYLIPYGFDAGSQGRSIKSAVSASEFAKKVGTLAAHGKALLLLDACHSGAVGARSYLAGGTALWRKRSSTRSPERPTRRASSSFRRWPTRWRTRSGR